MSATIRFGTLMPHPPLLIPSIGKEETKAVRQTQEALQKACKEITEFQPDVVILISPHGPMFEDAITIMDAESLHGGLSEFGVQQSYSVSSDRELVRIIAELAKQEGVPLILVEEGVKKSYRIEKELDYGAIIPLHFLQEAGYEGKVILLAPGFVPYEMAYQAGMCIQKAAEQLGRQAVVVASGDNSHSLQEGAPAGLAREGTIFDELLQEAIALSDWMKLFELEPDFLERAAEDTLSSLFLLLGAFDGVQLTGTSLSYEAPFGVGYTVATFHPAASSVPSLLDNIYESKRERINHVRKQESDYVHLARMAVETYVKEERLIRLTAIPSHLAEKAPCFVSIKKNGKLRGCIGTIRPSADNLAEEIIQNAIASCSEDDRFFPVEGDELAELVYTVDVLGPQEEVREKSQLDPKKYGLIVTDGGKSGLLLPDLEGVDTVEQQILYVKEKAGIPPEQQHVSMYRFRVNRYP